MKILLIEDDKDTAKYIVKGLREKGYSVDWVDNGKDGLYLSLYEDYDVVILDRMLPTIDGLEILKAMRSSGNNTPVLVLSALGDVQERVKGLKMGADDYLAKPYSFSELVARVEVLLRRRDSKIDDNKSIKIADMVIDLENYTVVRAHKKIELKPTEFKLLLYLAKNKGSVVTRNMLLENVWGYNFDPQTNVIDVHISRLRSKIDKGFSKQLIKTIRGIGYKIEE